MVEHFTRPDLFVVVAYFLMSRLATWLTTITIIVLQNHFPLFAINRYRRGVQYLGGELLGLQEYLPQWTQNFPVSRFFEESMTSIIVVYPRICAHALLIFSAT